MRGLLRRSARAGTEPERPIRVSRLPPGAQWPHYTQQFFIL
jgi:hypothetical protein